LNGDSAQKLFFKRLWLLVIVVFVMVTADHLGLFIGAWAASNYLLTRLMIHKNKWDAAKASGDLALKNFALGLGWLAAAFLILYLLTGSTSIHSIQQKTCLLIG